MLGTERTVEPRESGKPAFGFALFLGPPGLLECGNRVAISKGGGKGGKPAFGFSMLSTDCHFNNLCGSGSGVLCDRKLLSSDVLATLVDTSGGLIAEAAEH